MRHVQPLRAGGIIAHPDTSPSFETLAALWNRVSRWRQTGGRAVAAMVPLAKRKNRRKAAPRVYAGELAELAAA
jgi:hypothetical protein